MGRPRLAQPRARGLEEHDHPLGSLTEETTRLKREPGKDLLAHGGVRFARSLVTAGLVDELRLLVHPIALGRGQSIFDGLEAPIRFVDVRTIPFRTGLVVVESHPNPPTDQKPPSKR